VPHGLACAVSLPYVLEANSAVIHESIGRLVESIGDGNRREGDPVRWLADKVRALLKQFRLPPDLREYKIPAERIGEIARMSSGSSMNGNPRELNLQEREEILSSILWGAERSRI